MRRFSDRLICASSTSTDPSQAFATTDGYSDETASDSSTSKDLEYSALVEMIGLYQTVKVLEAEYSLVTGGTGKRTKDEESKLG